MSTTSRSSEVLTGSQKELILQLVETCGSISHVRLPFTNVGRRMGYRHAAIWDGRRLSGLKWSGPEQLCKRRHSARPSATQRQSGLARRLNATRPCRRPHERDHTSRPCIIGLPPSGARNGLLAPSPTRSSSVPSICLCNTSRIVRWAPPTLRPTGGSTSWIGLPDGSSAWDIVPVWSHSRCHPREGFQERPKHWKCPLYSIPYLAVSQLPSQYPVNARKIPAKRQDCATIQGYIPRVTASQPLQVSKAG